MAKKKKPKKPKSSSTKTKKMAKTADRYSLYLDSVQAPHVDVDFFGRVYKNRFKTNAQVLREDFCGTFAVCCAWAQSKPKREAWGVDIDPEPLKWGKEHTFARLEPSEQERVHPVQGDVRTAETPPADIVAAQNFSYCIFKSRDELRAYFERAKAHLKDEGIFILDLFGGYESIEDEREEVTDHGDFEYVWEQHKYDPINAFGTYKIHFRFPDGSEMKNAFTYDWRLWTIPEIREVLLEAGFDAAEVYWEGTDAGSGEGTGRYHKQTQGDCDPAWTCYIVGVKDS